MGVLAFNCTGVRLARVQDSHLLSGAEVTPEARAQADRLLEGV